MKFKPTHKFSSYDENSYKTVTKAFLTMAPGQAGVEVQVAPNTATIDFDGNVPAVPVSFKLQVALNGVPSHHLGKDVIMEALQIYYVDSSSNIEVMKPEFIQDVQKDETKVNVYHITFGMDVKILMLTVVKVFKREGIGQGEKQPVSLHIERADWVKQKENV
jgi:hypothetical protein